MPWWIIFLSLPASTIDVSVNSNSLPSARCRERMSHIFMHACPAIMCTQGQGRFLNINCRPRKQIASPMDLGGQTSRWLLMKSAGIQSKTLCNNLNMSLLLDPVFRFSRSIRFNMNLCCLNFWDIQSQGLSRSHTLHDNTLL